MRSRCFGEQGIEQTELPISISDWLVVFWLLTAVEVFDRCRCLPFWDRCSRRVRPRTAVHRCRRRKKGLTTKYGAACDWAVVTYHGG